jgi:hypothetical protein
MVDGIADNDNRIRVINSDGNAVKLSVVQRNRGFDVFWDESGANLWTNNSYRTERW